MANNATADTIAEYPMTTARKIRSVATPAPISRIARRRISAPPPARVTDTDGLARRHLMLEQDDRVRSLVRALANRIAELTEGLPRNTRPLLDLTDLGLRCVVMRAEPASGAAAGLLSPREREIAHMVGLGHTNKAIAVALQISLYTVATHLRRIFVKLGVPSRAAMVAALSGNPHLLAVSQRVNEPVVPMRRRPP
jgi:DNA-binding CsgD family transcriptional regulator